MKIRNLFNNYFLRMRNEGSSKKIIIKNKVNLEIDKTATIIVNGKLVLGCSDYKHEYRYLNLSMSENSKLIVNDKQQIYSGSYISVSKNATLEFGGNSYINYGCNIDCFEHISIGRDTIIAKQVYIRDSDNHNIEYEGYLKSAPIKIGDHCWIGMRATILKGVTIGDGCIIAAGSLVNKDIPPNCLATGVPAKVVKENVSWTR